MGEADAALSCQRPALGCVGKWWRRQPYLPTAPAALSASLPRPRPSPCAITRPVSAPGRLSLLALPCHEDPSLVHPVQTPGPFLGLGLGRWFV